jgi:hypothetical protein
MWLPLRDANFEAFDRVTERTLDSRHAATLPLICQFVLVRSALLFKHEIPILFSPEN